MLRTLEYIEINGQAQCISMRSNGENLPLLLYIHGGPGDSALVFEYYDTIETKKEFHWFEESAHFPQWEETDKFYETMIDMLETHPAK